ncbi:hypothetical protein [Alloprevotella sp. OH1205_COT-284]|nr:hypothetical protein [Alloprevotella sp. OH1205_COT-284]
MLFFSAMLPLAVGRAAATLLLPADEKQKQIQYPCLLNVYMKTSN